jgi:two-component system nitrogen regulation response regulator NtrX
VRSISLRSRSRLQKLLSAVQKALKHDTPPARPPLTLDAFGRSTFIKEFKRRLEQAAAKAPVLLLKGATGGMAEICARTLQPPRSPWLDLSSVSSALTQEMLEKISGGILFVPDLAALGKMQQMNLTYAVDRLEKHNLQLIAATVTCRCQLWVNPAGTANCSPSWVKSGWPCPRWQAMRMNCPRSPACC